VKQENDILETLGAAALAVAVIAVLFKAFESAKKTGIPVMIEENGVLYEIAPDGQKHFIRRLPSRPNVNIPQKFTLRR
jgi:hypothetical protein